MGGYRAAPHRPIDEVEREMAETFVRCEMRLDPKHASLLLPAPIDQSIKAQYGMVEVIQSAMRLWRKTLQTKALKRARSDRDAYFSDLDAAVDDIKPEFFKDGSHGHGSEVIRQAAIEDTRKRYG